MPFEITLPQEGTRKIPVVTERRFKITLPSGERINQTQKTPFAILRRETLPEQIGAGVSKALYERAPFGRRIVTALEPAKAQELERFTPETIAEKLGAGIGGLFAFAPSFVATKGLVGAPVAARVAPLVSRAAPIVQRGVPLALETGVSLSSAEALQPGTFGERAERAAKAFLPGTALGATGLIRNLPLQVGTSAGLGATLAPGGERIPQAILFGGLPLVSRVSERLAGVSPKEARVSSEAGAAAITSPTEAPPRVQPLGPQRSTQVIEPSSVSRKIPPSKKTGVSIQSLPSEFEIGTISPTSSKKILQPTANVKLLLEGAERMKPSFDEALKSVASEVPGSAFSKSRVKKMDRIQTKLSIKGRFAQEVSDYLGGRIVVSRIPKTQDVADSLSKRYRIVQDENFLENPRLGYRARHLSVELENGMTAEVQVAPSEIAKAKEIASPIYKSLRSEGISSSQIRIAEKRLNQIFGRAWARQLALDKQLEGQAEIVPKVPISQERTAQIAQSVSEAAQRVEKPMSAFQVARETFKAQMEIFKEGRNLFKAILRNGGLRPFRGEVESEEFREIPLFLRRKEGQPLDKMAATLRDQGFPVEDGEALRQQIIRLKSSKRPQAQEILEEARQRVEESLEDAPSIARAANIRLDKLKTTEGAKEVLKQTADQFEVEMEIDAQRRGVIHRNQLRRLASELGMTPLDLAKNAPGTAANAETLLAARATLSASAETVYRAAQQLTQSQRGTPVWDQAVESFRSLYESHVNTQIAVSGLVAEAGRALEQQKAIVGPSKTVQKFLEAVIQDQGGIQSDREAVRLAQELSGLTEQNLTEAISRASHATLIQKIEEFATAVKLGGPFINIPTFARNSIGNAVMTLLKTPQRLFAATNEIARSVFTKTPRERFFGEIVADWGGLMAGTRKATIDSIRPLVEASRRGGPREVARVLLDEQSSFEESARAGEVLRRTGAIKGLKGKIIRTPFRVLTWADNFQSEIVRQGEIRAQSYRQVAKEGLKGYDLFQRAEEISKNPSREILSAADQEALRRTFRSPLGKWGKKVNELRQFPGVKLMIPFYRTLVNIGKAEADLFLGGGLIKALRRSGVERSEALAIAQTGMLINAALFIEAMQGNIQGSWKELNKAEKDALRAQGIQPFSFRVGDRWVSYRSLEPITFPVFFMADLSESIKRGRAGEEDYSKGISRVVTALSRGLLEQSFLLGINDVFMAMDDPERGLERFAQNLITGALIPTSVGAIARARDPFIREPKGILQAVQARIPGLSERVPPARDVFGEPVRRPGIPELEPINPIRVSRQISDPIRQELERLDIDLGFPTERVGGRRLTQEEEQALLRVSGNVIRRRLERLMASGQYRSLSFEDQQRFVNKIIRDTRQQARNALLIRMELRHLGFGRPSLTPVQEDRIRRIIQSDIYKRADDSARRRVLSRRLGTNQ